MSSDPRRSVPVPTSIDVWNTGTRLLEHHPERRGTRRNTAGTRRNAEPQKGRNAERNICPNRGTHFLIQCNSSSWCPPCQLTTQRDNRRQVDLEIYLDNRLKFFL